MDGHDLKFTDMDDSYIYLKLREAEGKKSNWCCEVMKALGIEGLQCHDEIGRDIHRIFVNFCPHCGAPLSDKAKEKGCGGSCCG